MDVLWMEISDCWGVLMNLKDVWKCVQEDCGGDGVILVELPIQKLVWSVDSYTIVQVRYTYVYTQLLHSMCYVGVALFALYGTGSSSSFISNVACSGNESRLTDCTYDNTTLTQCNDVGVLCRGIK